MTYSSPFVYLRILGYLGDNTTAVEKWGVGMKIPHGSTPITPAEMSAFLTACSGPVATFHQNTQLAAGTSTYLKQLTGALVGEDGKYVGGGAQATTIYNYGTLTGGLGTPVNPWSTAIVLSLRTQFSRGRASNGRIYWPALATAVQATTGVFLTATCQTIATAAATMLDGINAAAEANLGSTQNVSVMSNVGSGTLAPVTSVRVGCKPDRQERRERDLVENYQSANVTSSLAAIEDFANTPIGSVVRP